MQDVNLPDASFRGGRVCKCGVAPYFVLVHRSSNALLAYSTRRRTATRSHHRHKLVIAVRNRSAPTALVLAPASFREPTMRYIDSVVVRSS